MIKTEEIDDLLICKVCRGKKVMINEVTKENQLCPKCMGSGKLQKL